MIKVLDSFQHSKTGVRYPEIAEVGSAKSVSDLEKGKPVSMEGFACLYEYELSLTLKTKFVSNEVMLEDRLRLASAIIQEELYRDVRVKIQRAMSLVGVDHIELQKELADILKMTTEVR